MTDDRTDEEKSLWAAIEKTRLEIERATYLNETTRTYLERWRTEVQPVHEEKERSREMAFGFAKMAIQTMFLLNGGALIAFPAFAGLVGAAFKEHISIFLLSAGGFVTGLVFIAITGLLAYISMDADTEAIRQREEIVKIDLIKAQNPDGFTPDMQKIQDEAKQARDASYQRAVGLRRRALGLGIGSMFAFVFGASFAAVVLSSA